MLDAHVHLERGPYTEGWLRRFVDQAQASGVDQLHLLEHSFRFHEFRQIYHSIGEHGLAGAYQKRWLASKCVLSLSEYEQFVAAIRKLIFPITVRFGLEVCYFPEHEGTIREVLAGYDWDFVTGAVHWVDGFGFDHRKNLPIWRSIDVNRLYRRYYDMMIQAIQSGLFDVIAHPDSLKCFGFYSTEGLNDLYREVAVNARRHRVSLEFSSGLVINYSRQELGVNQDFLKALKNHGVTLVTASDAHRPEDVGRFIREAELILANSP